MNTLYCVDTMEYYTAIKNEWSKNTSKGIAEFHKYNGESKRAQRGTY